MLRDVFPYLLDEGEYIESATIWESSRICAVAVDGQPQRSRNGVNFVLSELIAGIGEVAILAGLTQIVSVFDARIYRVLKAVGCNPQLIGRPRRIGGTMSYAGLFDTGEGLCRLCRRSGRSSASRPRRRKNSLSLKHAASPPSPAARGHSPDLARSRSHDCARRSLLLGSVARRQRLRAARGFRRRQEPDACAASPRRRAQAPIAIRRLSASNT